jgi:hypothetical protein
MPRRSLTLVAALGLILGCQDSPTNTAPPVDEEVPVTLDVQPVHDILADPLVHELLGGLTDRATARSFQHLIDALATPPTQSQLNQIHWTFGQLLGDLTPVEAEAEDEIERAVLELIFEDAKVVLDSLEQKKGT